MDVFADYEPERTLFHQLIDPQNPHHILLFYGESGSGKSALVRSCVSAVPAHIPFASLEFKQGQHSLPDIFHILGRKAGWPHLPTFTRRIATLQGQPQAATDLNWQADLPTHLQTVLQIESIADRRTRATTLTQAWFDDARSFQAPFLLFLDVYEQANSDIQEWLPHTFLPLVAETPKMRVVVAGQHVPDANNITWGHCCHRRHLSGVPDAEAWLPVVAAMGRQLPSLDYLAGACAMAKGNPSEIIKFIETLPRQRTAAAAAAIDRGQLRKWMKEHLHETDVNGICFDMDIDPSDLGTKFTDKITNLLIYTQKRGRLEELIRRARETCPDVPWL